MNMSKKVIILIISHKKEPYLTLEQTIRNTWASIKYPDIQVLFLHSKPGITPYINNDELFVNGVEDMLNIGYKTINAYDYCLNNLHCDYVYRTNLSSYIYQKGLYDYINTLTIDNIYSGIIGNHNGLKFVSGCGYLLSKNLMQYVVDNKHIWDHVSHYDDVSLAKVLQSASITPSYNTRIDITTTSALQSFDVSTIQDCFHFRCKNEYDRSHDSRVMHMLHNYFINKQ